MTDSSTAPDLEAVDAWWRAANYLTVGQIYLQTNPLLREALEPDHIKPRLLGHWGTSPGISLVSAHLNRLIRRTGQHVLDITGPGHGGPAILAGSWLDGSYSQIYPDVSRDEAGMDRLFRQFSTPGGVPSHVSVPTPGSIHEGGELGYALVHAFGAAFDHPDLLVACVIGDGEAETGPLAGSWTGIQFLNPRRDGAVLPILHLNGYKISGPTVFGRASDDELASFLHGHGWAPTIVSGDEPAAVHEALDEAIGAAHERIAEIQHDARSGSSPTAPPPWPALVLRTPKGWTGPHELDGILIEGSFRSHQVPLPKAKDDPAQLEMLEAWMRSYRPDELFDDRGAPSDQVLSVNPTGELRLGATPYANGGGLLVSLEQPDWRHLALDVPSPATTRAESTRRLGEMCKAILERNAEESNFRLYCPDETHSNRLDAVFDVTERCFVGEPGPGDPPLGPDGRVMEILSEHCCQGWLEGYLLTGRHGLFATYEAFAMVSASMLVQHAKWLEHGIHLDWRQPIAGLNVLLTSTCWRNDHNGFSHQGPGLIDTVLSKKGTVARIYLPPDANCLLSVADHCFRSRDKVNLIVIDKQPQLQYLDAEAANAHCSHGLGRWEWCSNDDGDDVDVVLACAGDIPTMETVAAAWLLRHHVPDLKVRVVNVVDLMKLFPADQHPNGLDPIAFDDLFTESTHVVFAFHGYQHAIHMLLHGRPNPGRFHVRGFQEEGTTTTPFDMVVLNEISRYHLASEALRRARRRPEGADVLEQECEKALALHRLYVDTHLEDPPEIRDWTWTE